MSDSRFTAAQKGVPLAEAMPCRSAAEAKKSRKEQQARRGAKKSASARARSKAAGGAAPAGTLPAPASLSTAERLRLLAAFETVLGGVYTHLPLKRARYGFDPVQRLRILRSEVKSFDDNAFHVELAAIVTQMRDYHTRYTWPAAFAGKVAVLPFLVEMYGPDAAPTYVVTKVGKGLDAGFVPGVLLQYWNGVPIDRAVVRHADEECAGRPDGWRSASLQSLTFRSMEYGPPPDEEWVVVGYRKSDAAGVPTGALKEVRVPWKVVDPGAASGVTAGGPSGERKELRRTRAVNPAAAAVRRAKMLLFAPEALVGETPPEAAPLVSAVRARGRSARPRGRALAASTIATAIPDTLRVQTLQVPGGAVGYLRIWAFDADPDKFIAELLRVIPLLPQNGLIIDVRGNPGGYILAAELALQLFTPKHIEPVRFSVLATPFTRDMAALPALADELSPWKASLDAAVRNGELYSQPVPITDPADCNAIGQQYGGPVVLVGDTNTYSAGDLFSAGFVDNDIGPVPLRRRSDRRRRRQRLGLRRAAQGAGRHGDRAAAAHRRHRPVVLVSPRHPRRPERRPDDRGRRRRRRALRDDAQRPARRQRRPADALRRAAAPAAAQRARGRARQARPQGELQRARPRSHRRLRRRPSGRQLSGRRRRQRRRALRRREQARRGGGIQGRPAPAAAPRRGQALEARIDGVPEA